MHLLTKLLLICCFLGVLPSGAQEVETGTGVLCDTIAQMEQLLAATRQTRSLNLALQTVNETAQNPQACGVGQVAFHRGRTIKTVQTPEGARDIVEITVVGGMTPQGFRPVTPQVQYTLFKSKGQEI